VTPQPSRSHAPSTESAPSLPDYPTTRGSPAGERSLRWMVRRSRVSVVVTAAACWRSTVASAWAESERCHRCGGRNVCWRAPSPLWNLVMRGNDINGKALYGDLVCIGCFFELAANAGVAGRWNVTVEPDPGWMQTITPSGRVWNPVAWLWESAS
jgi:hypothetical protein